eukprot:TRINITY_DN371_c0_g1_i1.p1 TRINITY_DN371_c0_g1~~TRINITY_DN371_c0_g1_i1.p1  ORF type:complete len:224 (-),score=19.93 TRINITY_DN371_c0_g1_i1:187-786(-)
MFGVFVSGCLVQTEGHQTSPTSLIFGVEGKTPPHHLAVFMTGSKALPTDSCATIHIAWPPFNNVWSYIGYLTNEHPSAIFKLSQKTGGGSARPSFGSTAQFGQAHHQLLVGIELAGRAENEHQHGSRAQLQEQATADRVLFARFTLNSLYNYLASYMREMQDQLQRVTVKVVPLTALDAWHAAFERKIRLDPAFWRREQ